jgi:exonuclease 3'-5' domain-containing protein 1
MELAVRSGPRQYVSGLAKCIEKHANLPWVELQRWRQTKALVGQLWDPKRGGSYQIFNQRPIRVDIIRYCA